MIASADLNSDGRGLQHRAHLARASSPLLPRAAGQIDFEEYKKIVGYSENRRATPDYANQTRIYSSMAVSYTHLTLPTKA